MLSSLQVIESLALWRYWIFKAILNFKLRYRGTKLGLMWPVFSTLFVVLVIGTVWGVLLKKQNIADYYLYLLTGYSIWFVISSSVEQGCRNIGIRNSGGAPFFTVILERVTLASIQFFLVMPAVILGMVFLGNPSLESLFMIPVMLFLLVIWSVGLICLLVFLVTFFPDSKHLVNAIMRLSFLATPIIWNIEQLGEYKDYIWFNPFYIPLEASRLTLIGGINNSLFISFFLYAICLLTIGLLLVKIKLSEIVK